MYVAPLGHIIMTACQPDIPYTDVHAYRCSKKYNLVVIPYYLPLLISRCDDWHPIYNLLRTA